MSKNIAGVGQYQDVLKHQLMPSARSPFTTKNVNKYAVEVKIISCREGIRQLPVSFSETIIVETH